MGPLRERPVKKWFPNKDRARRYANRLFKRIEKRWVNVDVWVVTVSGYYGVQAVFYPMEMFE